MRYVYVLVLIIVVLFLARYYRYKKLLKNSAYTVGIVVDNTFNKQGEVGDIIYEYKVGGKLWKKRQGNLIFEVDPSSGKFVVLYDKKNPNSSIIWLNYPCPEYNLGSNIDSVVVESRIQLSPWSLDLVSNGWE